MTFSGSTEILRDPIASSLRDRAFRAFEIVAGDADCLGIAVSGGSDSTALLILAADWAGPHRTLHVATVDHGLRPEAPEEARQVAALCARLGLPHDTLVWRPGRSVAQADARAARHRLIALWARAHALPVVCLGHTRDDRIETFLLRARAGSHWRGLAGPMPSAPSPVWPEGAGVRLARPLLAFGRQALRDEVSRRGIPWIDDPSNEKTQYERVRMRGLTARLDESAHARIIAIMDRLAELRAAVVASAREAFETHVRSASTEASLDAAAFRALSAETRLRLIEALVMGAGGAKLLPKTARLEHLTRRLTLPCGIGAGATLSGAWVTEAGPALRFRTAPARRSTEARSDAGMSRQFSPGFNIGRAEALLGDPRIPGLRV